MKSKLIPVSGHHSLVLFASPEDVDLVGDLDPETGATYLNAFLLGRWVGYYDNGTTAGTVAESIKWRLFTFSLSECEIEQGRTVDTEQHRSAVTLLRNIYADIVKKLDEDLKHNLHRAHHQGVYQSCYDRVPVAAAISSYLCRIKVVE